jgi:hypothetical protein
MGRSSETLGTPAKNTLSSNPSALVAIGSTTYFTATDAVQGFELWKSDGTTAGTVSGPGVLMLRTRRWLCILLWLGKLALQGCAKMTPTMQVHTGKTGDVTYEVRGTGLTKESRLANGDVEVTVLSTGFQDDQKKKRVRPQYNVSTN